MKRAPVEELNRYNMLLSEDKSDEALAYLRRLYSKYPGDSNLIIELGSLLLKRKENISEAFFYFSLAKNSNTENRINNELGIYYIENGEFEKAIEYFKKIKPTSEKASGYKYHGLLKAYLHTEDYKKAIVCCNALKELKEQGIYNVEHLICARAFSLYKLDEFKYTDLNTCSYYIRQLIAYNKEDVIEHIKEHLRYNEETEKNIKEFGSIFNDNINFEELYDKCSEYIKDRKPNSYGLLDFYKMKFDENIGESYNGMPTNCVEILTYPNTKKVLTIYPFYMNHIHKDIKIHSHPVKKKNRNNYTKKLKKKPKK